MRIKVDIPEDDYDEIGKCIVRAFDALSSLEGFIEDFVDEAKRDPDGDPDWLASMENELKWVRQAQRRLNEWGVMPDLGARRMRKQK